MTRARLDLLAARFVLRAKPTPKPRLHACGAELQPLYEGSAYARCTRCRATIHIGGSK